MTPASPVSPLSSVALPLLSIKTSPVMFATKLEMDEVACTNPYPLCRLGVVLVRAIAPVCSALSTPAGVSVGLFWMISAAIPAALAAAALVPEKVG